LDFAAPVAQGGAVIGVPASPWTKEARALLLLAWPIILGNLAQSVIQATDLILLGRVSADALAAGSLGFNLFVPFLVVGIGLMAAVSPLVAAERGRRRHSVRDVRRTVRQGMWLAVTLTIPCWAILWNAPTLLRWMGQEADLAAAAGGFVRIVMWSLLPINLFFALRNFIAGIERPNWGAAVLAAQVVVNAALGYVLVFGKLGVPAMGVNGAALASALANSFVFVALALVVAFARPFRRYAIFGRFWRPDWPRYRELARIGLPISATLLFEVTVFAAAVFLMGLIGRDSIAAHAIALQIAAASFMVPLGLAQAGTVRVGLAYGAHDRAGVGRAGWTAIMLGTAFMAVMAMMLLLFPRPLIGIFIDIADPKNAQVVALAVTFLIVAAVFQIVDGAQVLGAGVLRCSAIGSWGWARGRCWRSRWGWTGSASGSASRAGLRWSRRS
jgi:multidrug resistance protein, MATE family